MRIEKDCSYVFELVERTELTVVKIAVVDPVIIIGKRGPWCQPARRQKPFSSCNETIQERAHVRIVETRENNIVKP